MEENLFGNTFFRSESLRTNSKNSSETNKKHLQAKTTHKFNAFKVSFCMDETKVK
jgi:hypothetical protein